MPHKKLAALLAYLAFTAPKLHDREKLANLLWGSRLDTQARQSLRQTLFMLRQTIGPEALVSKGDKIGLTPNFIDCDARRIEELILEGTRLSLAEAFDLYDGCLLPDVEVGEEAWTDWLVSERRRLEETALNAFVSYGEIELDLGHADRALEISRRVLDNHDLREDAHRLSIQALIAAGRKAEAIKHYQNLSALLRRELSTEPDSATQSIIIELDSRQSARNSPDLIEIAEPMPAQPHRIFVAAQYDATSSMAGIRSGVAERRPLTIMTCEMIDPMPLSAAIDAEEMNDRVSSFHQLVVDVVAQFEGFVAQYLTNSIQVYFGYPAAHEHDAEQAVRAGLAVLDAFGELRAACGEMIEVRVAITSSEVVVGEQLGSGDTTQRLAIGESLTLATQLLAMGAPGQVVIAASTRRLVGQLFECRTLNDTDLDGLPSLLEAWHVCGEKISASRFEARLAGAMSPIVGRQEEIDLLLRRWQQVKLRQGRVVLLSGEPGIGKSRLAEHIRSKIEGDPHLCLRFFCSPHHTHSQLHPFIAQLEHAANFERGSSAKVRLEKLATLFKQSATKVSREVALIAELLAVPTDEHCPAIDVSPQQKREMTLTALLDHLNHLSERSPFLMVFEDVHWIDPTSLDLLNRIIARVADLPVLLLITFRPEFQPTWVGQPHVTLLSLNRLSSHDSSSIIRSTVQNKVLPEIVIEKILSRTDGVPLFIEEFTRALLDYRPSPEMTESHELDVSPSSLAVPMTLQASLVAQLDRLGSIKELALIGAAIGREFSHELIAAVSGWSPMDLSAALKELTAHGLISYRGTPPDATYLFKHALLQDAAYGTMLKNRRCRLHSSIAKVLVERYQDLAERQPEIVAHHFTEAGLASEAVDYWTRAGQLACEKSAHHEAVGFFEQALRALEMLPDTRETLQQAIDLRFDLKTSLIPLGKFETILGYLGDARVLCAKLDDQRRLCQLSVHMCHAFGLSGDSKKAVVCGQDALAFAETLEDPPLQVAAAVFLVVACFSTLDYRTAEKLFLDVLQLLDTEVDLEQVPFAGFPGARAHAYLTRIYADLGKFNEGLVHGEEGVRVTDALADPYSRAVACWCLADLHVARGELDRALKLLERGSAIARDWNLPFLVAGHSASLGYVYGLLGQAIEGLPFLEQAVSVFETMGHRFALSLFLVPLGETCFLANRIEDARQFAEQALALAREHGQRSGEAGALRLLGDIAARGDQTERAEAHYLAALLLAAELELRPLIARCRHGLGSLYLQTTKRDLARPQLIAARTMYGDMGMSFWLDRLEAEISQLQ